MKEKGKIGKRNEEKRKWGKGEKRERKRRGAVRASGDCDRGRPRVACEPREVGHAVGGEEEKGEREKEGAGFAAAGRGASRWMRKMGRELNSDVGLSGRDSRN